MTNHSLQSFDLRRLGRRALLAIGAAFAVARGKAAAEPRTDATVVFICDQGYGKSLVAARHFDRLAAQRGLRMRALARGANPGTSVSQSIAEGLARDGFSVAGFAPSRATGAELADARRVVLIATTPELPARRGPVERWDGVSALSDNYDRARDDIVARVSALLDRLEAEAHRK